VFLSRNTLIGTKRTFAMRNGNGRFGSEHSKLFAKAGFDIWLGSHN
jgi:hypothetical protein